MFEDIQYLKEQKVRDFIDISSYKTTDFDVNTPEGYCLVSTDVLHFLPNPKKYIEKCASSIQKGGFLLLADKIVDADDAAVNTEEYFKDPTHRRFYTAEEIIGFTKDWFRLEFFTLKNDKGFFIFKKI